jgi:hypothetical protein
LDASTVEINNDPTTWHLYGSLNAGPNYPDVNLRRQKAVWAPIVVIPGLLPSPADTKAENSARVKASRRIESIVTSFSGGVFLGELRETLRMIRHPFQGLHRGVKGYLGGLKKGRRGTKAQRQKFLENWYLECSFGWLPFLHDLNDARDFLKARAKHLEQEIVPFKVAGVESEMSGPFVNGALSGSMSLQWNIYGNRKTIVVYAGGINSKAQSPKTWTADALGLGPRSFVPTLWELLPWSFLVDYFTNVGDVITGWSNQSVAMAWGRWTTIKLHEYAVRGMKATPSASLLTIWINDFVPGESFVRIKTVSRRQADHISPPTFQFELPNTGMKWLNIAALLSARGRLEPF